MYKIILFAFATLLSHGFAKVSPDFIKPCPGLNPDCTRQRAQEILPLFTKGIPELGVDPTDPLERDYVGLDLAGGLKVELFNGKATGLRKCVVEIASINRATLEGQLKLRCNVTIKGKYKASGRILIININGDGDAKIKASNVILDAKYKLKQVERNGVMYAEVDDYKVEQQYGDKVTFALTNLFKGNPELSETVLAFLNVNWKEITDEFGKPIIDTLVGLVTAVIKKFFAAVPMNELIVD